jgi:hypothetical protein
VTTGDTWRVRTPSIPQPVHETDPAAAKPMRATLYWCLLAPCTGLLAPGSVARSLFGPSHGTKRLHSARVRICVMSPDEDDPEAAAREAVGLTPRRPEPEEPDPAGVPEWIRQIDAKLDPNNDTEDPGWLRSLKAFVKSDYQSAEIIFAGLFLSLCLSYGIYLVRAYKLAVFGSDKISLW